MWIAKKSAFKVKTTNTIPDLTLAIRTNGQVSSTGMCASEILFEAPCYVDTATPLVIADGDVLYNTNGTVRVGDDKWYRVTIAVVDGTRYIAQVDNSGVMTSVSECP